MAQSHRMPSHDFTHREQWPMANSHLFLSPRASHLVHPFSSKSPFSPLLKHFDKIPTAIKF